MESDVRERLARLEDRVLVSHVDRFKNHENKLEELSDDLSQLTARLNHLIVLLAANFGIQFVKLLPFAGKLGL